MDKVFKQLLEENTPKANPLIMNGLATHFMKYSERYINSVLESASASFPQGLEYLRIEHCTPEEAFGELTKLSNNKRTFDLAESSVYLTKVMFKFEGELLPPRYLLLPYVSDGGILHISGTKYRLSPVLSDKVFSPGTDSVFVKLLRDRIIFERQYHTVVIDGIAENTQVVWSQIYRKTVAVKKMTKTTKAETCAVHYLLAKYGYTEMCNRYLGFVPVMGEGDITEENYPRDKWIICESLRIKPKTFLGEYYTPTKIKIAVPRDKWDNYTQSFIAGIFYVIDHFPDQAKLAFKDEVATWMVMLGNILFSGIFGMAKLYDDVREHFNSLDQYLDPVVIGELETLGYNVNNFYDLLAVIIKNFNNWITSTGDHNTSLYGKKMEVLYYALNTVTFAIFRANFKLNKIASKKQLTRKDVIETLTRQMSTGVIYGLSSPNLATSTVSYSGDNMYPKITAAVAQQECVSGAMRGKRTRTIVNASKRAHESMAELGSILFLSKSNPSPAIHGNMYANVDQYTGSVVGHDKFKELLTVTGNKLRVNGYSDLGITVLGEEEEELSHMD